jgi:hypothetical protein
VPFFHFHGFRHPLSTQNLGDAMNGHEGVAHVVLDNEASGEVFADALLAATGVGPQYLDSSAYDAAVVLSLAAIAASRDLEDPSSVTGAQVRDAISMLETGSEVIRTGRSEMAKAIASLRVGTAVNYEGASGPVDFGANGNALGRLAHYVGVNGVWEERELYDCTRPDCPLIE